MQVFDLTPVPLTISQSKFIELKIPVPLVILLDYRVSRLGWGGEGILGGGRSLCFKVSHVIVWYCTNHDIGKRWVGGEGEREF